MDKVINAYTWFMAHKVDLINIVSYVITAATLIVKLTPTQKDDAVLGKIVKFIGKYIALNKAV